MTGTSQPDLAPPPFDARFDGMGCPCALRLEGVDPGFARRMLQTAHAEVARLDRKYSHFRDDSLVADIGRSAGTGRRIEVDAETADLLDLADHLFRRSDGRFDITAGPLTRLWDFRNGRIPDPRALAAARATIGWDRIEWQRPWLHLPVPGMQLDLGGLVKEYAADRVATLLRKAGCRHGVVDLGSDIVVLGPHADGRPWRIGIKAPRAPGRTAGYILLAAGAMATSGDYERMMMIDGHRYTHIIDPRRGRPVDGLASVSVQAQDCLGAGAAATIAMLLGADAGPRWLREQGLTHLCIDTLGRASGSILPPNA